MKNRLLFSLIAWFFSISILASSVLSAVEIRRGSWIRDVEIEDALTSYVNFLADKSGLGTEQVRVHLIKNSDVNAFVTLESHLVLHSGLILRTENLGQLMGVLAHEIGHIVAGHSAHRQGTLHKMSLPFMALMGVGGALCAMGSPEAGMAMMLGGAHIFERQFLQYTREQESAADQIALHLLDQLKWSAKGFKEFFRILLRSEYRSGHPEEAYQRTHPMTTERLEIAQDHIAHSAYTEAPFPVELERSYERSKAKLRAWEDKPGRTLARCKHDNSDLCIYQKAIALREQDIDQAIQLVDILLNKTPRDPYLWDLKGQILFEGGRLNEAIIAYQKAVELHPDSGLLRLSLVHALLERHSDQRTAQQALDHLQRIKNNEQDNPLLWHLFAQAYGRLDNVGMMVGAQVEEALAEGDFKTAKQLAMRAQKYLPTGVPARLRIDDILHMIEDMNYNSSDFDAEITQNLASY